MPSYIRTYPVPCGGAFLFSDAWQCPAPTIFELDIWRTANLMLKRYGKDAVVQASVRVDELLDEGDAEGAKIWQQIVAAIKELERQKPADREAVH